MENEKLLENKVKKTKTLDGTIIEFVDKCLGCGTIELGGKLIPEGAYNNEDFQYSSTFLSESCGLKAYPVYLKGAEFPYKKCPHHQ